jgi:MFS family permease
MSTFRNSLRALPRPFWVLVGATFVTRFGVFVVPFLTLFMSRQGYTPQQAGLAVAAYSVGSFFAALVGGWLADRIGRNVTMAISALSGAACMLFLSQATDLPWLVVLSLLAGFVSEAGSPASSALVQDLVPLEHRVAAYAVQRFAVNLAWAFGPAAAGFLAEHSFFWLFAGDAITSAIFGIIAWRFLPRGQRGCKLSSGWSHALSSIRVNKPFVSLFLACVAISFIFRQTSTTYTLHFQQSGHPMHLCGLVLALNGVLICLLEMPLTALTRGWLVRPAIALGYIGMASSFLTLSFSNSVWAFTVCMILFTCGEMMAFSRQQAYAASLAPEDMRGRYSGFLGLGWSVGNISGSLLGLSLYQFQPDAVWLCCAVVGFVAARLLMGTWLIGRKTPE